MGPVTFGGKAEGSNAGYDTVDAIANICTTAGNRFGLWQRL